MEIPLPAGGNAGHARAHVRCSASLTTVLATTSNAQISDAAHPDGSDVFRFDISLSLLESELKRLGLETQSRVHVMVEIGRSNESVTTNHDKRSRLAWLAEEQETYIDPYVATRRITT